MANLSVQKMPILCFKTNENMRSKIKLKQWKWQTKLISMAAFLLQTADVLEQFIPNFISRDDLTLTTLGKRESASLWKVCISVCVCYSVRDISIFLFTFSTFKMTTFVITVNRRKLVVCYVNFKVDNGLYTV